jgi:FkbM family methyltransferase
MSELRGAPLWVGPASALIRRLPMGRYRVTSRLPRVEPFEWRLPAELGGLRYACDLGDDIAREACFTGLYAPQESALVRRTLAEGDTFVDVGANWGYFTLLAAQRVGDSGRVVAMEPDPRMFALLAGNVSRNRLRNVLLSADAAAEGPGSATLAPFVDGTGNRGVSALVERGEGVTVETRALDELLDQMEIESVDLVKVDVEGAELRVLRGMEEGLRRGRYRRVLVELHPLADPRLPDEVTTFLREIGMQGWWVDHSAASTRRFAYGRAAISELLTPVRGDTSSGEWPHQLWLAAGVTP